MGTINTEDIKKANAHTSAMALTAAWAETFRNYALGNDEALSDDPSASFNVFLHLTAQGAAKSLYEQAARINEVNENTAILPKSLLNKLNSDELTGIFGKPSCTTIAFCIKESDIIDYSVVNAGYENDQDAIRYLVINKNMTVTFEGHPEFLLPYNVIIKCKPVRTKIEDPVTGTTYKTIHNIFANYDLPDSKNDGMLSIYNIRSPNISSRKMRYDGETYIAFFLKMYQISRKTVEFYVSDPNTSDTSINFENSLVGFEVFRKRVTGESFYLMGPGLPEGNNIITENSFNYSYDYKRNSNNVNISFSKMNNNTSLSVGDIIRIVTYTTKGDEGNITFPYMINNLNTLIINYNQDLGKLNQSKMLDIIVLAFARDTESVGGKNQLSLDEIRSLIISKKYSRNILITNNEIINKAKELGLDAFKSRHDIISLYYRGIDKLKYQSMILSTGMDDFEFNLDLVPPLQQNKNLRLIKPTDVFVYDKNTKKFKFKPHNNPSNPNDNLESYRQYVENYNSTSNIENILQASFPFHIQYKNTTDPSLLVYDMSIDDIQYLEFTEYNEDVTMDKIDISFMKIYRNPFKGHNDGSFDKTVGDTYFIQFLVYTGQNTISKLYEQYLNSDYINSQIIDDYNKQYLKFMVKMTGSNSNDSFQINPTNVLITNIDTMVNDGFIAYQATVRTDNYVNEDKKINMFGVKNVGSVSNDFTSNALVDTSVTFTIEGSFIDSEINPNNNISIKYKSDIVKFVNYMTDLFGIDFDIKTEIPNYMRWLEVVPEKYESVVYEKNPNYVEDNELSVTDPNHYEYNIELSDLGQPIFHALANGGIGPKFKILHNIGDIKYKYVNPETEEFVYEDDYNPDVMIGYEKTVVIKHKKDEFKYFKKDENGLDVLITNENDEEASAKLEYYMLPEKINYVGILKNVSWINRLYFANDVLYDRIRNLYLDLVDRVSTIKGLLFDGGEIYAGLKKTSGKSHKYKAYKLNSGISEYINNIALSIEYRVKFKDNIATDYKKQEIINATVKYISELGDDDLSIDNLFDFVKQVVTDIKYINIVRINDYYNGEVQTIINDTSVTDEIITVSQKMNVDDVTGEISFIPDITVEIIN